MELESRGAVSDVSEHKEKKFESEGLGQTIQGSRQWCVEWTPRKTLDWGMARAVKYVELLGVRTCHRQGLPRYRRWGDKGEGVIACPWSLGKGSLRLSPAVTSECRCVGWEQGSPCETSPVHSAEWALSPGISGLRENHSTCIPLEHSILALSGEPEDEVHEPKTSPS